MPLPPSATLSAIRVNIFPRGGEKRHFNLYRVPFVDGLVSPCGRVRVFSHVIEIGETTIRQADQFTVFINEKRVPDHQFSILRARKPAQAKPAAQYKRSRGRAGADIFAHPITL